MHIFRRGGCRRRDGQSDSAPDSRLTPSSDQAGPSRAPSDSPSPVPSPLPSPITSHQESLIPARHSVATMQDTRECIVPYGDSFHNYVRVVHEINRIVNNHWRGDSISYTSTPTSTKELWWNKFKDKYDELELARRNSQATDESSGSEPSVGNNLDLWLEASEGSKGGRILGMSSLSRTHRLSSISSSTSPVVRTQIHNLTEEVVTLKGIIAQRDQDMIQRDEEMRLMRQQQDLIMRHLHLASPPSQIPPSAPDGDDDDDDDGGDDSS